MSNAETGRLADELAIRELIARYSDAVNRRDSAAWGATWATDAVWHIAPGLSPEGRDNIVALWEQLMSGFPFVVQMPSACLVEVEGDQARCRFYLCEYGKREDGGGMLTLGVYHDRLRREKEGWRFVERRFHPLYSGPPDLSGAAAGFPKELS